MATVTLDVPVNVDEAVARAFRNSAPQTLQTIQEHGQFLVSNVLGFVALSSAGARNHALYEQDFYDWTQQTAALIRAHQWYDLDPVALAEEVSDLGVSQYNAVSSDLYQVLVHLLKWLYQPDYRVDSHSWRDTIVEHRDRIDRICARMPSLRPQLPTMLTDEYPRARRRAHYQTGFRLETFPLTCPWPLAQVLDPDFWPGDEDSFSTFRTREEETDDPL
jgi:hypothetical protein